MQPQTRKPWRKGTRSQRRAESEHSRLTGNAMVIMRRMDSLEDAIRSRRSWDDIEFRYDQVRRALGKALGREDGTQ